jgi:hypothetical protein
MTCIDSVHLLLRSMNKCTSIFCTKSNSFKFINYESLDLYHDSCTGRRNRNQPSPTLTPGRLRRPGATSSPPLAPLLVLNPSLRHRRRWPRNASAAGSQPGAVLGLEGGAHSSLSAVVVSGSGGWSATAAVGGQRRHDAGPALVSSGPGGTRWHACVPASLRGLIINGNIIKHEAVCCLSLEFMDCKLLQKML